MAGDTTFFVGVLSAALFVIAFLYSSVGHAGASGYIAVMTLMGLGAAVIRPTSLALNILVGCIAAVQFARAGHFDWRLFWPFALPAIPLAFVGGGIQLPTAVFQVLLGAVLLVSAAYFFARPQEKQALKAPPVPVALVVGACIGLLSGLTGTGGGIFLTPLLLAAGWAASKPAAAVSALFILCNSVAGLFGFVLKTGSLPSLALPFGIAVVLGGLLGATLGARRFNVPTIKRLLALVLVFAGLKLVLT